MEKHSPTELAQKIEKETQEKYSGKYYKTDSVSRSFDVSSNEYFNTLLNFKLDLIKMRLTPQSRMLDLCCATGEHLFSLSPFINEGFGVDFSKQFIDKAIEKKNISRLSNLHFIEGNARKLAYSNNTFDIVYSFSSLYYMPKIEEVVSEIARVLKNGGTGILDMGNLYSLNTIVCGAYPELAEPCHISVKKMRRILSTYFQIEEHYSFQLFPYWGNKPKWLGLILSPGLKKMMEKKIGGKMIDQWVSSMPLFRNFAFRHLFVCKKKSL